MTGYPAVADTSGPGPWGLVVRGHAGSGDVKWVAGRGYGVAVRPPVSGRERGATSTSRSVEGEGDEFVLGLGRAGRL